MKKHLKCYSFISNIYKNQNLIINYNKLKEIESQKRIDLKGKRIVFKTFISDVNEI